MIVFSLVAALALSTPIPAPEPGLESFSEVIDALRAGPKDAATLRRLYTRGADPAASPPYDLTLALTARAAAAKLDATLPTLDPGRPLPRAIPRVLPTSPDDAWLGLAGVAASLAYEPGERITAQLKSWGYASPTLLENSLPGTRAFVAERGDHVLVTFCGTEVGPTDVVTDLNFDFVRAGKYGGGRVHRGFDAGLNSIWPALDAALARARKHDPNRPTLFTGHSLGGALATLAYARVRQSLKYPSLQGGAPSARLVTLGKPRVGDEAFARLPVFRRGAVIRAIHRHDPVPHAPPRGIGYRHEDNARVAWIGDDRALHTLKNEDAARDEIPQDLDPSAWRRWWNGPDGRVEDHNETNYSVVLWRIFER